MPLNHYAAMEIGSNEDLSTEILLRLPPKSVLEFKSVSKLWLSIVFSPRFRRLHASGCRPNPSPTGLLFLVANHHHHRHKFEFASVPLIKSGNNNHYHISSYRYKIKGTTRKLTYRTSCNGLQLYKSYDNNDRSTYVGEYYVTNPTTKEFKKIPTPPVLPNTNHCVQQYLAFDPSRSPHYGVVIVSFVKHTKIEIDVYSSENEIRGPDRNTSSFDLDHTTPPTNAMQEIFCNGIIHLLGFFWTSMLCFDLNKQSFIKCPLPSGPFRSGVVRYYIKHSRGTIYIVVGTGIGLDVSPLLDVYALKSDYSGWFLKYQLDLSSIAIDCQRIKPNFPSPRGHCIFMMSESITRFSHLCEEDGEEEEGPTMVFAAFDQLVAYNLMRKTTKIIARLLDYTSSRSFQGVFPHIDTLTIV